MYFLIYILLCIVVGYFGRNKEIGFVGFMLLSIVLTPVATTIVLLISHDRRAGYPPESRTSR